MSKTDVDAGDGPDLSVGDDAEKGDSVAGSSPGAEPQENVEDWGSAEDGSDGTSSGSERGVYAKTYDPNKDQDLHLLAMKILGVVAVTGISLGSVLTAMGRELPDFIGVIVGSAVTAIAALFSKKS